MKQEGNGREAAGTVANGTVAAGETGIFAKLAKCTIPSKILHFRYSQDFR